VALLPETQQAPTYKPVPNKKDGGPMARHLFYCSAGMPADPQIFNAVENCIFDGCNASGKIDNDET
jgi:hypothetical protein